MGGGPHRLCLCRIALHRSLRLSGALLLPVEIRELMRGITWLRSAVLIGNLAVVIYMIYVIRDNRRERRAAALGAAG